MITKKRNDEEMWGPLVIFILCIAGLLLLFSLFSPYVFTRITDEVDYQFNEHTGVIGDTFGIMNPFIGLIGILLTFLAFYMQIKANKLQRDQFNLSRNDDKKLLIHNQKTEAFDNLELLSVNLESIIKDINSKGKRIRDYEKALRDAPFESHILKRTASKNYLKILEINRGAIYKAYKFFSVSENSDYIRLYNILDFLPEYFDDFYPRVTNFISESFSQKMTLRGKLLEFLDLNSRVLTQIELQDYSPSVPRENTRLINDAIMINHEILQENHDSDGNPLSETDWSIVDNRLLKPYIEKALHLKRDGLLIIELIPIIEFASNVRKDITLLKNRSIEFADQVKLQYDDIFSDEVGELSVETTLKQINDKIKTSLTTAKVDIDSFYN